MNKWLLTVVAIAACPPAQAFAWHDGPPTAFVLDWPGYSAYPPGTTFKKEVVNGTYPHWYLKQVPTVVPRLTYREDVTKVRTWVNVATLVDEMQSVLTYVPVQRLVEKNVTTCVIVPMFLVDPAGNPLLSCRAEVKTHKVAYAVQDYVPVTKQVAVKVTKMLPREKIVEHKQNVPVVVYDQQMTTQWQVMNVPYQKVVVVPIYHPGPECTPFWP
jgi:hypothetical protein